MVKFLKAAFVVGVILLGITLAVIALGNDGQTSRAQPMPAAVSESSCSYANALSDLVVRGGGVFEKVTAGGDKEAAIAEVSALIGQLEARPQPRNTVLMRAVAWNALDKERTLLRSMARGEQDTYLAGAWLDSIDSVTDEVKKACQ